MFNYNKIALTLMLCMGMATNVEATRVKVCLYWKTDTQVYAFKMIELDIDPKKPLMPEIIEAGATEIPALKSTNVKYNITIVPYGQEKGSAIDSEKPLPEDYHETSYNELCTLSIDMRPAGEVNPVAIDAYMPDSTGTIKKQDSRTLLHIDMTKPLKLEILRHAKTIFETSQIDLNDPTIGFTVTAEPDKQLDPTKPLIAQVPYDSCTLKLNISRRDAVEIFLNLPIVTNILKKSANILNEQSQTLIQASLISSGLLAVITEAGSELATNLEPNIKSLLESFLGSMSGSVERQVKLRQWAQGLDKDILKWMITVLQISSDQDSLELILHSLRTGYTLKQLSLTQPSGLQSIATNFTAVMNALFQSVSLKQFQKPSASELSKFIELEQIGRSGFFRKPKKFLVLQKELELIIKHGMEECSLDELMRNMVNINNEEQLIKLLEIMIAKTPQAVTGNHYELVSWRIDCNNTLPWPEIEENLKKTERVELYTGPGRWTNKYLASNQTR